MIDYIPPDIPKAVVEFVDQHGYYDKNADRRWFKYLTIWNNYEVYTYNAYHNEELISWGKPRLVLYDCTNVRHPYKEEQKSLWPVFEHYGSYIKQPHMCHLDKKAFNNHTKPSDFKKIKHKTPKYIPKAVVNKIDSYDLDKYFPNVNTRKIRYLKTIDNKYEIYVFYWENNFTRKKTSYRPLVYDCTKVRRPGGGEFPELHKNETYKLNVFSRPNLCTSD